MLRHVKLPRRGAVPRFGFEAHDDVLVRVVQMDCELGGEDGFRGRRDSAILPDGVC